MPFKVFIAESNTPADHYYGQLDGYAANEVLKVRQIETQYRTVFNRKMLEAAVKEADKLGADIFHLSCHGNKDGFRLADGEDLTWTEVAEIFAPFANEKRILVNSSCEGGHNGVSSAFKKSESRFGYICGSTDDVVTFHDSCVAWTILYNVLANKGSIKKGPFQAAIDAINKVVPGAFVYRRWDDDAEIYKYYPTEK